MKNPTLACSFSQSVSALGLDQMRPSQCGKVIEVDASQAVSQRLTTLGVLPGVSVEMVRLAPLGDPMTFAIHGQQFSLRLKDASAVRVELQPSASF